jgi:[ribosomal protein S5]-alanine N-acetyltransferase
MTPITIRLLREHDAEELLAFELANRAYFRQSVPDRGDDYYHLDTMRRLLASFVEEQEQGMLYMHLIRNEAGALVGRVNLVDVTRGDLPEASLGYRVGEAFAGRGHASAAVRLALEAAFGPYGLQRVTAHTTPANIGSQRVLLKAGFTETGRTKGALELNGVTTDFIHYVRERQV